MKMTTLYAALSGALLLGTAALSPAQNMTTTTTDKATSPQSGAVHATRDKADKVTSGGAKDGMSRDEYKREKDRIEADAKAAKEKCKGMKDNAKDICEAEAKSNEKVAKKELDYKNKPTDKNKNDLEKMKVEAAYEVAKEKCEDQKGAEMASCKKQAKADKDRQMAALRGGDRKNVASKDASGSGAASRTGGSASGTAGMTSGNTSSMMSPGGTPSSTTSNTTTSGTSTGAAGSASKSSAGDTGAAKPGQDKTGK